jgi:hypothetical protein
MRNPPVPQDPSMTLSDTELIVLAEEVNNPDISNVDILEQLFSKANYNFNKSDLYSEIVNSLSENLCFELSKRLRESLK